MKLHSIVRKTLQVLLMPVLLTWGGQLYAQQQVSGQVIDAIGPVIGATVMVDGTSTGTQTDLDGNFTLNVPEGTAVTVVCMGYRDVKTALKNGMVITLAEDATLLEEVVVVGYGVQKKETLSGAIAVAGEKMLKEKGMPISDDIYTVDEAVAANAWKPLDRMLELGR